MKADNFFSRLYRAFFHGAVPDTALGLPRKYALLITAYLSRKTAQWSVLRFKVVLFVAGGLVAGACYPYTEALVPVTARR